VLRILRGEDEATSINDTFIVPIPKVEDPEELGQFRPISLCNILYKITSRVVANRLKQILPKVYQKSSLLLFLGILLQIT